jgi:hypothetical protein
MTGKRLSNQQLTNGHICTTWNGAKIINGYFKFLIGCKEKHLLASDRKAAGVRQQWHWHRHLQSCTLSKAIERGFGSDRLTLILLTFQHVHIPPPNQPNWPHTYTRRVVSGALFDYGVLIVIKEGQTALKAISISECPRLFRE